jgi:hypothetical protein
VGAQAGVSGLIVALVALLLLTGCEPARPCAWGLVINSTIACESGPGGNTPTNTGTMKAR